MAKHANKTSPTVQAREQTDNGALLLDEVVRVGLDAVEVDVADSRFVTGARQSLDKRALGRHLCYLLEARRKVPSDLSAVMRLRAGYA